LHRKMPDSGIRKRSRRSTYQIPAASGRHGTTLNRPSFSLILTLFTVLHLGESPKMEAVNELVLRHSQAPQSRPNRHDVVEILLAKPVRNRRDRMTGIDRLVDLSDCRLRNGRTKLALRSNLRPLRLTALEELVEAHGVGRHVPHHSQSVTPRQPLFSRFHPLTSPHSSPTLAP
jgi:hypothetical protein